MRTFTKLAGPIAAGVVTSMFIVIGLLAGIAIPLVKVTFNVVWFIVTSSNGWVSELAISKLKGADRLETPIGKSTEYKLFAGISIVLVKAMVRGTVVKTVRLLGVRTIGKLEIYVIVAINAVVEYYTKLVL